MSELGPVVVLIGATSAEGRELYGVMRERAIAVREWRLYRDRPWGAEHDEVDDEDDFEEEVLEPGQVDVGGADVVFLCGRPEAAMEFGPRALAAGAVVIDLTQAFAERGDALLAVPEVNSDAIGEHCDAVLACPVPGAIALAVVLNPLMRAADLKRLVVAAYEPVSTAGSAAIEELAEQSRDLLSGCSVEPGVFPHRIAFNLIPQVGDFVAGARTRGEWSIESQTRRVLDLPDLPIAVTSVRVPTFFGQAYVVHVETEGPLDATAARALLREAPGVLLSDEEGGAAYPTLADVVGSEATHVGRVRDDPTVAHGLSLWIAIDGLRKGAALNAVQIAERSLRERG